MGLPTLEDIAEFSKYLFGHDIHQEYKMKRQEIRKNEDNLKKRVSKLTKNYTFEVLRQVVRYAPLPYEVLVVYVTITEDWSASRYFLASTLWRTEEQAALIFYELKKLAPKLNRFVEGLEKLANTLDPEKTNLVEKPYKDS